MKAFRLERQLDLDPRRAALYRILGALCALLLGALVLVATGRNPVWILGQAIDAIFSRQRGIEGVALRATPILMTALSVALCLRLRIWNIGAGGQFLAGAFAAVGVGINLDAPGWVVLFAMAAAGTLAGAAWILVPALARAYWGVNEIITTLLLNFVAVQLAAWAALGFWRDEEAFAIQSTKSIEDTLPGIPGTESLSIALFFPLVIAGVLWWVFRSTRAGYEIDMIGGNPKAAAFAGINVPRRMVAVMLVTGAIAGLGGMIQLAGSPGAQQLNAGFGAQYGLSGFIVATIAAGSFLGLVVAGFLIAAMFFAGLILQTRGLSVYIILALYGIILIGVAVGEIAARFRLVRADLDIAPPESP
jgi:simple sugar transport system permease protein